ncbi:MAG: hypothetical protein V5A61_01950 [Haloarculaceae archaeon]
MSRSLVEAVRRPEHTGERRCWPCTVVNVVLVAGVALAAARSRRLAALPVALVGAALVYLRGYVVPGTPRFAPRLVAALPLPYDPFDHEPPGRDPPREALAGAEADAATGDTEGSTAAPAQDGESVAERSERGDGERAPRTGAEPDALGDAVEPDGEAVLSALVEAGVVVVEADRVAPDPAFHEEWTAEMADLAALETDALAEAVLEVAHAAEAEVFRDRGEEWVVLGDGSGGFAGRTWLSRPVAVAEAGAVRALSGWGLDRPTRLAAAGALRTFLETCPDCGTPLRETSAAACCGGYTNPTEEPADVLFCPDCDVRLFTFED